MTKKHLATALLALALTSVCNAQYRISGNVPGLQDGTMYLEIKGKVTDSVKVEKGCFTIENRNVMEAPTYVHMRHSGNRWGCAFWMGNDNVDFTTANDIPVIKGSKTEDEYQEYCRTLEPVWNYGKQLKAQMKDNAKADSIMNIVKTRYQAMADSAFIVFAGKHPSSYITLNHIYNMRVMDKIPFKKLSRYVNMLTPGAFKGEQWQTLYELYEKDEVLEPGHPMPPFAMNDLYGKTVDLAAMKGKCVLLTLSRYGTKDYDADLMMRKRLYGKYAKKGLEMVDYAFNTDTVGVMKAPANMGLTWRFVTDFKDFDGPWLKEHAIDHITQNFLIDRNGIIVCRNLFGKELEKEIEKMFN